MGYWRLIDRVIDRADIILEVLDARLVDLTRNAELERRVRAKGKQLLFVINKCDLADKKVLERKKKELQPSVFISSRDHLGTTMLRQKILSVGRKETVMVGVCGYPNTGKSSVINVLSGQSKARTSPESGFTRSIQLARADKRIMLIDSPGVIPYDDNDEALLAIIGAKDASRLKMPDVAAARLIGMLEGKVERFYGVKKGGVATDVDSKAEAADSVIESIAVKTGKLLKGGLPDTDAASRTIIRDWQRGRIRL